MPKATGIIMSGDHPLLILEGKKTMTRRTYRLEEINKNPDEWLYSEGSSPPGRLTFFNKQDNSIVTIKCPYGQVGDRLVIKEAWATENQYNHLKPLEVPRTAKIWYLADKQYNPYIMGKVRLAMFMCKWMSRATPEITEVRVERLQEITSGDCIKEGIEKPHNVQGVGQEAALDYMYRQLWDSLNAKRGYGWDGNWWVWTIRFRMLEQ